MSLYLRKVENKDIDLIFGWANDLAVRQNAFNTEQIPYENHVKWFKKMLTNKDVHMYIMCNSDNTPVGQIRINIEDENAIIDYSIASDMRKKGYGEAMINLLKAKIISENFNIKKLIGQVKYENTASARVFQKCGFERNDKQEYIEFILLTTENM